MFDRAGAKKTISFKKIAEISLSTSIYLYICNTNN